MTGVAFGGEAAPERIHPQRRLKPAGRRSRMGMMRPMHGFLAGAAFAALLAASAGAAVVNGPALIAHYDPIIRKIGRAHV